MLGLPGYLIGIYQADRESKLDLQTFEAPFPYRAKYYVQTVMQIELL